MPAPAKIELRTSELPDDPQARHQLLVDVFGQYLFWVRSTSQADKRHLVESEEARSELGRLYRGPFEGVAAMSPKDREGAYDFAQACADGCLIGLLRLLAHQGFDLQLNDAVLRFKLTLEICDEETGEVIDEEIINRGGRHFVDYWGRWLNRCNK
jgi:hypothetical protein